MGRKRREEEELRVGEGGTSPDEEREPPEDEDIQKAAARLEDQAQSSESDTEGRLGRGTERIGTDRLGTTHERRESAQSQRTLRRCGPMLPWEVATPNEAYGVEQDRVRDWHRYSTMRREAGSGRSRFGRILCQAG